MTSSPGASAAVVQEDPAEQLHCEQLEIDDRPFSLQQSRADQLHCEQHERAEHLHCAQSARDDRLKARVDSWLQSRRDLKSRFLGRLRPHCSAIRRL